MGNEAKVRIGGDAAGATRATDQTRKGIKDAGDQAKVTGDQMKRAAEQAVEAEKKYEATVQTVIQKLKAKETQAKATEEALKRMGKAATPAGGGVGRGALALGPAPTVAGFAPGGVGQALSKVGGNVGSSFGALGSGLNSAVPALAALTVASVGVKIGLEALAAAGERAAQAVSARAVANEERAAATKQALKQLGESAMAAAVEGGTGLTGAIAKGTSLQTIRDIASKTGMSVDQSADIAGKTKGLSDGDRKAIVDAATNAARLGVDPVKVTDELLGVRAKSDAGFLGQLKPEDALRNAGNLFDHLSDSQIQAGINRGSAGNASDNELDNLGKLNAYNNRAGVARLETAINPKAIEQTNISTAENAEAIKDPVAAAMKKIDEGNKKQIVLLEKMADANGKMVELLADISATLKGGAGGYGSQARGVRAATAR